MIDVAAWCSIWQPNQTQEPTLVTLARLSVQDVMPSDPPVPPADESRPWAIRAWCQRLSFGLAGLAEVGLIGGTSGLLSRGNGSAVLLAIPLAWPIFYGVVYAFAYAIALIDQGGPIMDRYPGWYQALFPPPARWLMNVFFSISANIALIAFPLPILFLSGLLVWAAVAGEATS